MTGDATIEPPLEVSPVGAASSASSTVAGWMPQPVANVWDFALLDLQGTPITVGSLVLAVLLLALGIKAAQIVSRLGVGVFSKRTGAHPGAVAAIRSLVFYSLCAVVLLLALKVANVPLSIFAVAGGAIAIGVGFGSQNILNNFISGIILLIERPVRVGDVIQLDGPQSVNGVVRRIGARSTRIVTGENLELVVPNSTLLQHNVVNWTLTDDEVRASVSVGVAYGSPLGPARELMLEAAGDHGLVLKSPVPVVHCEDFGDNAIVLRLFFWMRVRRAFERRTVESDLRFKVEKLFRNAGITIAFPQRDVHLHAGKPIDVRIAP